MLRIAARNVLRQKRRTVLTMLTMTGGFVLASFSISWADGSYHEVIEIFTRQRLGHIQVHAAGYQERPSLYKTIRKPVEIGRVVASVSGVEAWSPRLYTAGLASVENQSAAVRIVGVDPEREERTTGLTGRLVSGDTLDAASHDAVLLGTALADRLNAAAGDELTLVSQAADGSIANDIYRVTGLVDTGEDMQNRTQLFMTLQSAQDLFVLPGQAHEIAVTVNRLDEVRPVSRRIASELDDEQLQVQPWQEFARDFYHAMKVDQRGMWIMLGIILLIVAVGVLNTVLMAVLERQREHGLLRALGTRPAALAALILTEVSLMAVGSIGVGAVLALIANSALSIYGIELPQPITYGGMTFSRLHTELNLRSFVIPAVAVVLTAFGAGLYPAWKAARTDPAVAMGRH
mgnify:CR=1 FL=1